MTTIQLRRGTAAEWATANPVLAEGEQGFETDTGLFKIGDGAAAWNALDYAGGNGAGGPADTDELPEGSTNLYFTTARAAAAAPVQPADLANKVDKVSGKQLSTEDYTTPEKTKLGGVATGATANATDTQLRDRGTHTGQQPSTTISDFTEAVQDAVAAFLGAGSNVVVDYNDAANTLTISASGGSSGLTVEDVRDAIGAAIVGVGNISVAYNDALDTITISTTATQNATDAALRDRSTHTGSQPASTISDSTAVGRAVLTAADALAARTAIGAGTSSLALGTTGTTAAAGNDSRITGAVQKSGSATGLWMGTTLPATGDVGVLYVVTA